MRAIKLPSFSKPRKSVMLILGLVIGASGLVAYVSSTKVQAACAAPAVNMGSATTTISVPTTGTYRVWSRIMSGTASSDNSYNLEVDGGNCYVVGNNNSMPTGSWQWVDYQNGSTASKIDIPLTAGNHTFKTIGTEAGVQLDRVILTSDTTASECNPPTNAGDSCANLDTPPVISAPTASPNTVTQGSGVALSVTASDDNGISKVEFFDGNTLLGVATKGTSNSYSFTWTTSTSTATGAHNIKARATDTSGKTTDSVTVAVTVNAPPVVNNPPTVTLSANKTTVVRNQPVTFNAVAIDNDSAPVRDVEFFDGTTSLGFGTAGASNNYFINWQTTNSTSLGTHSITAKATDTAGLSKTSTAVNVTVNADSAPTTQITSPGSGATVSGNTTVSASASDDVAVTKVEFYLDGTMVSSDSISPYSFSWNTAGSTDGTHTLQSKAYDASGNIGTSSTVSVTVNNTPPPPPSATVMRINVGGNNYKDGAGNTWTADQYASGGSTDNQAVGRDIINTTDDTLYQDERYGSMTYNVPISNGNYTVRLHFAEIWSGCQKVSCRVFNVNVNDQPFLTNFDIYAKVGGYAADIEQVNTSVSNNNLKISLTAIAGKDNPQITGIEVIPAVTLAPPTNLTATATSASSINLAWNAPTNMQGITGYYIQRNGVTIAQTGLVNSYADNNVSSEVNYSYTVLSRNDSGVVSSPSNTATATPPKPPDTTPPAVPTNLTTTFVSQSQVNFSWNGSSDAVSYIVYRNNEELATVNSTSYGDATVSPATTYSYTVVALDAAGNGSTKSNALSVTTPAVEPSPSEAEIILTDDTYISGSNRTRNFGSANKVVTSSNNYIYFKIKVSGVSNKTVTRALMTLAVNDSSSSGGILRRQLSTDWTEGTVTYNNYPQTDWSANLGSLGKVTSGSKVTIDLTPYITGDGVYGFTLYNGLSDSAGFGSKEAAYNVNKPQLSITVQ